MQQLWGNDLDDEWQGRVVVLGNGLELHLDGLPDEGSGGGISSYYAIPSWQTNVSMANNGGSMANRNIPDVALTADNIFVSYNNGDASGTYYFMGTSCAAPLWAGFTALVNQQSVAARQIRWVFESRALRHWQRRQLCGLFPRHHHRQQHQQEHAELFCAPSGYDSAPGGAHRPGPT